MFKIIVNSYLTFFKNLPVILLYALPLLVLSAIEIYFEGLSSANYGVKYFIIMAVYLIPFVSAATDIAVYQRLLGFTKINPFNSPKTLVIYFLVQLGIGIIAVVPLYAVYYFLNINTGATLSHLWVAILLNMFLGIYFLARFNIILPLLVKGQMLKLKDFLAVTDYKYSQWVLAGFLIYGPYLVLNYVVPCPYLNMFFTCLYMLVFVCFNVTYISTKLNKCTPVISTKAAETAIAQELKTKVKKANKAVKTAAKTLKEKTTAAKAPKTVKKEGKNTKPAAKKTVKKAPKPKAPKLKPALAKV